MAVEIFSQPGSLANRTHDRSHRRPVPSHFTDAAIIGRSSQFEGRRLRTRETLHRGPGKSLLEQIAAVQSRLVQRRRILALEVDADRTRRAADPFEQLSFSGESPGVGEADDYLV